MNGNNGRNENKKSKSYYLACQVEPGMFPEEFLAVFEGIDPSSDSQKIQIQLLVDEELVKLHGGMPSRGKPENGDLLVELIQMSEDWAIIALPQPAIPVGPTAIVPNDRLTQVG